MIFIILSVSVVSAVDVNSTEVLEIDDNDESIVELEAVNDTDSIVELEAVNDTDSIVELEAVNDTDSIVGLENDNNVNSIVEMQQENVLESKSTSVSVNSLKITTGKEISIYLKDADNSLLKNKNLIVTINKQEHKLFTGEKGIAKLKLDLPANKYTLQVKFIGDNVYSPVTKSFDVTVLKMNTVLTFSKTSLKNGEKLYAYLKGSDGSTIETVPIEFKVEGNTYTYYTNSKGRAGLKIKMSPGKYEINVNFAGNKYYNAVNKDIKLTVLKPISISIGNDILLTKGYLRIYLKSDYRYSIADKIIKITIKNKVYTKKTNSEGFVVFKPNQGKGKLTVKVVFSGTSTIASAKATKQVTGFKGVAKDPLKCKIPLKNGIPNVDYMTWRYVMANGNFKYTLLKSQYMDVLKRDSYCLYLNNKLSKYTFFKSKAEPKFNHIIKREKWNVIERALNTKIVKKNKNGYWPCQVTASLKGKSYTYAEVRDVQNTGYTCGPTSCSMCSQVLRNYFCEKYLGQKAGSNSYSGSSTSGLKKALEKCNFKCSYYYQSSFDKALKQLKKGGCALVFHTWSHYVCILDISKDGKKVLVGNPSGDYDYGSHEIPTNWLTVKYMKNRFNDYDTSGLIVKLNYKLSKSMKNKVNNFYSSMGTKWTRQNVNERIPQIQDPFY